MAYKIAVASSDGLNVNGHFGKTDFFRIVSVEDDGSYSMDEIRKTLEIDIGSTSDSSCVAGSQAFVGGCGGGGGGCGHSDPRIAGKIQTISDCRCVLCTNCGAGAEKQLQRKAITPFQIELPLSEALVRIIQYYDKVDHHISLRRE